MNTTQPKINYNSISKILTLRYDPDKDPNIKPLSDKDFVPIHTENVESKIGDIIREDLLSKYERLKFKHICISLSAGIDSGLTLVMMRSVLPDVEIECFSMGFGDEDDEVKRAREISQIYDCDFNGIIKEDILNELPKLISIAKEPRWNLYHYYLMENAKKKSNVFYAGDGGDELFGGYTFRYQKFLSLLSKKADWKEKAKLYLSCHERDWVPDQHKMFGSKIKFSWEKIYKIFRPYFDNDLFDLDQVFLADFNGKLLYDWLPTNIAFGKSLDLNIESIFLTNKMIKFATHIPWQMKYNPKIVKGKLPLHSILSKQKGFEKIQPIKKGFSVNMKSLWKKNTQEIVTRYVNLDSEIVKNKLISEKWIMATYKKLQEEDSELNLRYINKMLSVLSLEIWYKLFVSKSMNEKQKL